MNSNIFVKGIAHITGGGLLENIPRILPEGLGVVIEKKSWPMLPVFSCLQSIGDIEDTEMFRTFNMGIGLVLIVSPAYEKETKVFLENYSDVCTIGQVIKGNKKVQLV